MIKQTLTVEFQKTRHKKIWLVVAVLLAVQCLWAFWALSRWDESDLTQGWMYFLYQFPLLNCIMMPIIIAVVASRLADMEHKGQTLKLLETIQSAGNLFDNKFLCGVVYIIAAPILQTIVILLLGMLKNFKGDVPWKHIGFYLFSSILVNITIYVFQLILSLMFQNQMIPFTIGLAGCFIGLMSMFFPVSVQKLFLWGYYGVLMTTGLNYDSATRVSVFYWFDFNWSGLLTVIVIFLLLFGIGRTLF